MKYDMSHAIASLYPGEQWVLRGDSYEGLEWLSDKDMPSEDELIKEVDRLQKEYDSIEYQRLRSSEYPDFREYLDGIVKGDKKQIDKYIADCNAIKQKYPKPK